MTVTLTWMFFSRYLTTPYSCFIILQEVSCWEMQLFIQKAIVNQRLYYALLVKWCSTLFDSLKRCNRRIHVLYVCVQLVRDAIIYSKKRHCKSKTYYALLVKWCSTLFNPLPKDDAALQERWHLNWLCKDGVGKECHVDDKPLRYSQHPPIMNVTVQQERTEKLTKVWASRSDLS